MITAQHGLLRILVSQLLTKIGQFLFVECPNLDETVTMIFSQLFVSKLTENGASTNYRSKDLPLGHRASQWPRVCLSVIGHRKRQTQAH